MKTIALALLLLFSINARAGSSVTLYTEVNDQSTADVINQIHAANRVDTTDPIMFYINSPGGDVFDGEMIIDAMKASRRPIYTVDIGWAASMAAIIWTYGEQRLILPNGILMFHEMHVQVAGTLSQVTSELTILNGIANSVADHICSLAGITKSEYELREAPEWRVSSQEALDSHLATGVTLVKDYPLPVQDKKPKKFL